MNKDDLIELLDSLERQKYETDQSFSIEQTEILQSILRKYIQKYFNIDFI